MRDHYTKKLTIEIAVNNSELDKIQKDFTDLSKGFSSNTSKEYINKLNADYNAYNEHLKKIEKLKKMSASFAGINTKEAKEAKKTIDDALKSEQRSIGRKPTSKLIETVKDKMNDALENLTSAFIEGLKNIVNQIKESISEMASYNTSSSLFFNREALEQQLQWGTSASQTYGLTKAMNILGFSDIEDLMYANEEQRKALNKLTEKFSSYYDDMEASGFFQEYQEYSLQMEEFKMQFERSVAQFFINNKNTIIKVMDTSLQFMQWLMDVLGDLFGNTNTRSEEARAAAASDIIKQYSTTNNVTKSVNYSPNYNVGSIRDYETAQEANRQEYLRVLKVFDN